jgi:hypothetical protein
MIYPPEMLDILQSAAVSAWAGTVYRHMFGSHRPARGNTTERAGTNLVIYQQDLSTSDFEILAEEAITADERAC